MGGRGRLPAKLRHFTDQRLLTADSRSPSRSFLCRFHVEKAWTEGLLKHCTAEERPKAHSQLHALMYSTRTPAEALEAKELMDEEWRPLNARFANALEKGWFSEEWFGENGESGKKRRKPPEKRS